MTVVQIKSEAERRKITRLCHFTPLRNLVHIVASDEGLYSTAQLSATERQDFNPQDLARLDGHPDHISCSVQYPNAYYLRNKRRDARGEARLFPDWVCLYIEVHHLWRDDTMLCAHNAAGYGGTAVDGGAATFAAMFADRVVAPQRTWDRQQHPDCYPTDAQAEVLVHRQVPLSDVIGVAVENEAQAGDTYARLRHLGAPVDEFAFIVAPDFYDPTPLAVGLARGRRPVESAWHPPDYDQRDGDIPGIMSDGRPDQTSEYVGRAEGALLAAATGDALGWPIEPRGSRIGGTRSIEPQLGFIAWDRREGGRFSPFIRHVPAGSYSDDTQLVLAVARSLLHGESWWQHFTELELPTWTLYELGGGGAVRRAAKLWERGTAPWSADLKLADRRKYFDAGGNGVVMRIAPHAIAAIPDDSFATAATRIVADGAATHGHPRALVGALAAGYALWRALRWEGKPHYGELIDKTLAAQAEWMGLPDIDGWAPGWRSSADDALDADYGTIWDRTVEEMTALLISSNEAMGRGSLARDSEVLRDLGAYDKDGSAGTRTASAGLYLASRYVAQPPAGLLAAAFARNTDADTIAAVTGSLLGAMAGAAWLKPLTAGLQDAEYLRRIAAALVRETASTDRLGAAAVDVRRRVYRMLENAQTIEPVELPIFGRSRLLRLEEHPTESPNDIRTWWLATEEGQTIAVTRIRKLPDAERKPVTERPGQPSATTAADRAATETPDLYWFALLVKDLQRSAAFYRDVLGLRVARSSDAFLTFGQNLILQKADDNDLAAVAPGLDGESFASNGLVTILLDAAAFNRQRTALLKTGVPLSKIVDCGRERRFRLHDPDGHVIEIRSRSAHEPQSNVPS